VNFVEVVQKYVQVVNLHVSRSLLLLRRNSKNVVKRPSYATGDSQRTREMAHPAALSCITKGIFALSAQCLEPSAKIAQQVSHIFDSHRQADKPRGDSGILCCGTELILAPIDVEGDLDYRLDSS
jgi:hypothetical protein